MRRRKNRFSSGRRGRLRAWLLLLALLALFLFSGVPGCASRMTYSARGTMLFLPDNRF